MPKWRASAGSMILTLALALTLSRTLTQVARLGRVELLLATYYLLLRTSARSSAKSVQLQTQTMSSHISCHTVWKSLALTCSGVRG